MASTDTAPKCQHIGKTYGRIKVIKSVGRVGRRWRLQVECLNCGHVYQRWSDTLRKNRNAGGCERCHRSQQRQINERLFQWPNSREGRVE